MNVNVSAIIHHNDKVLVIHRAADDDYFPDYWGIPGGSMEDGDTCLEDTAVRETFEEVGLPIKPDRILFNNRTDKALFVVVTAQLANPDNYTEKLKLSEEIQNCQWIDLKELDNFNFTPFTKERLEIVLKELQKSKSRPQVQGG